MKNGRNMPQMRPGAGGGMMPWMRPGFGGGGIQNPAFTELRSAVLPREPGTSMFLGGDLATPAVMPREPGASQLFPRPRNRPAVMPGAGGGGIQNPAARVVFKPAVMPR